MGNHADWIGLDWARRNPIGLEPDWIGAVPIQSRLDWRRPNQSRLDWRRPNQSANPIPIRLAIGRRQSNRDWRQSNRDWHKSNDSDRDFPMIAHFRREHFRLTDFD